MSCKVHDQPVSFLVDSGASCSLIDYSVYESLCEKVPLDLEQVQDRFVLADGSSLVVHGGVEIVLQVEGREFPLTVVVANLGGRSAILGLDFLEQYEATLKVSHGNMTIGDTHIRLHREDATKGCCRVGLGETLSIPPGTCKIVDAVVDQGKLSSRKTVPGLGAVEGLPGLAEMCGVIMDRGLVTVRNGKVPVNLINVHDQTITLHKGKTLGQLQPVISVVKMSESGSQCHGETVQTPTKLLGMKDVPEHTRDVLDEETLSELSAEQTHKVCETILDYPEGFVVPGGKTGRTEVADHGVDVQGNSPSKQRYKPWPLAKQQAADEQVRKMLDDDIIEPSDSPWASPAVLVTKRDGSIRFCVDYRRVNSLTKKDAYPLPRIDDTLNTLGGAEWFCTMDLASGYWQVKMREEDKPKTAFVTRMGLFQFKVMPFGLTNAPATFQRLMDTVLKGLQWQRCLVYLDDIIIFGKTFDDTLQNLRMVMDRLKAAGLKLKASKCQWFKRSVKYLGHVVSSKGLQCDPEKIEAVQNWPVPQTVTQVRQFLGFAAYYRKFIHHFSKIAQPLTNLTKKSVRFSWNDDCQNAFETLKQLLVTAPVLAYPLSEGEYILDTDASNFAVGAVLSQVQNGEERVIAYASQTLNHSQQNYCTTKKELLAVVKFVEHFKYYLYGAHFTIRTDHASLKWLRNFKSVDGMLARWLSTLEKYHYTFVHRKGVYHTNADALSRLPTRKCPREDCSQCAHDVCPVSRETPSEPPEEQILVPDQEEWLNAWTPEELRAWQRADKDIKQVITWLESSADKPPWVEVAKCGQTMKAYYSQWASLKINNGLLCRQWYPQERDTRNRSVLQIVAPLEVRQRILQSLHNSPSGGHLGRNKTLGRVPHRFYWPRYKEHVILWCRRCDVCARSKPGPRRRRAKLGHVSVGAPLERVAVDIMGPLPKTDNDNEYLLVVGDYFTKWAEAFPLKNHTAQTVADVMVEEFVARYGLPRSLHSDQGREFESQLIAELCKLLRVKKTRTVPYNPKSDGLVERCNRTLKQMLTMLVDETQTNWDDHVPYVLMAYRASVHDSTKCTPNLLMLNRETNLPVDLMCGSPPETPQCPVAYVEWVRCAMDHAFEFARRNLHASTERHKTLYDQNSGSPKFTRGQSVWRYYPPKARQKFGHKWEGPYLVIQRVSDLCYRIQKQATAPSLVVHVDHLKLYEGNRPVESWLPTRDPAPAVDPGNQPGGEDVVIGQPSEPGSASLNREDENEVVGVGEGSEGLQRPESVPIPGTLDSSFEEGEESRDGIEIGDTELQSFSSPVPSTSKGPECSPLEPSLAVRQSKRPRKPKVDEAFMYY